MASLDINESTGRICEAVQVTSLKDRQFFYPVVATFAHALPKTYESVIGPENTAIQLHLTGEGAADFYLIREKEQWNLYGEMDQAPSSIVTLDGLTAWRLFTKGMIKTDAQQEASFDGDTKLGEILLNTVAIIA